MTQPPTQDVQDPTATLTPENLAALQENDSITIDEPQTPSVSEPIVENGEEINEEIEGTPLIEQPETGQTPKFEIPQETDPEELEDFSWKETAQTIGFEIKEDTYEAFLEGQKAFIEKQVAEKSKSIPKESLQKDFLSSLDEDTRLSVEMAISGTSDARIVQIKAEGQRYLGLSDKDFFIEDALSNLPDNAAAEQINTATKEAEEQFEAMEAAGVSKIIVNQKRAELSNFIGAQIAHIQTESKAKQAISQQNKEAEKQAFNSKLETYLSQKSEYLGVPLEKQHHEHIKAKITRGDASRLLQNPEILADFMLWREFGAEYVNKALNLSKAEGAFQEKKNLHNIPPKKPVLGKVQKPVTDPLEGLFQRMQAAQLS